MDIWQVGGELNFFILYIFLSCFLKTSAGVCFYIRLVMQEKSSEMTYLSTATPILWLDLC